MKNNNLMWIPVLIFVVFTIILVIQLILKLTGNSPSDAQILYVAMGSIISYPLIISYKIRTFVGEVNEFMKTTKNSFAKLRNEIKK